jgi:hypothetical protein
VLLTSTNDLHAIHAACKIVEAGDVAMAKTDKG